MVHVVRKWAFSEEGELLDLARTLVSESHHTYSCHFGIFALQSGEVFKGFYNDQILSGIWKFRDILINSMLLTWVSLSMTFCSYESLLWLSLFLLLVVLGNIDRCLSARPLFLQCAVLVFGRGDTLSCRHLIRCICACRGHRWRLWFPNEVILLAVGAVLTLDGRWVLGGCRCLVSLHSSHRVTTTVSKLLGDLV